MVQGKSVESLLDKHAPGGGSASSGAAVQRRLELVQMAKFKQTPGGIVLEFTDESKVFTKHGGSNIPMQFGFVDPRKPSTYDRTSYFPAAWDEDGCMTAVANAYDKVRSWKPVNEAVEEGVAVGQGPQGISISITIRRYIRQPGRIVSAYPSMNNTDMVQIGAQQTQPQMTGYSGYSQPYQPVMGNNGYPSMMGNNGYPSMMGGTGYSSMMGNTGYPPTSGYTGYPQTGYTGYLQTGYTGYPQTGYTGYLQTGYTGYPQTGYTGYQQTGYPQTTGYTGYPQTGHPQNNSQQYNSQQYGYSQNHVSPGQHHGSSQSGPLQQIDLEEQTRSTAIRNKLSELEVWSTQYHTMTAKQNLDYLTKTRGELILHASWNTATMELFPTETQKNIEAWIEHFRTELESQITTTNTDHPKSEQPKGERKGEPKGEQSMDVESPPSTDGWITRRHRVGGSQDNTNTFAVGEPGPGKTFRKQTLLPPDPIIPVNAPTGQLNLEN